MIRILNQEYYDDCKEGLISITLEHEPKTYKYVTITIDYASA